jgi:hypothetical protein
MMRSSSVSLILVVAAVTLLSATSPVQAGCPSYKLDCGQEGYLIGEVCCNRETEWCAPDDDLGPGYSKCAPKGTGRRLNTIFSPRPPSSKIRVGYLNITSILTPASNILSSNDLMAASAVAEITPELAAASLQDLLVHFIVVRGNTTLNGSYAPMDRFLTPGSIKSVFLGAPTHQDHDPAVIARASNLTLVSDKSDAVSQDQLTAMEFCPIRGDSILRLEVILYGFSDPHKMVTTPEHVNVLKQLTGARLGIVVGKQASMRSLAKTGEDSDPFQLTAMLGNSHCMGSKSKDCI